MSGQTPALSPEHPGAFDLSNDGRSLGDILGDAIRSEGPPPITRESETPAVEANPLWCHHRAAGFLAKTIAPLGEYDGMDVLRVFQSMPERQVEWLASPEGWAKLARYAADQLGVVSPNYRPTVH